MTTQHPTRQFLPRVFVNVRPFLGVALAAASFLLGSITARAANATPPDLMAYQGFLVDANGNPLAPTTPLNYPVIFRIYTASQNGTLLWSEQQIVTVDKGNFSVLLGQGTVFASEPRDPLSTVLTGGNASELYVSITVTIDGNTQEILPRLRLMTSPYSFLAEAATSIVRPNGTEVVSFTGGKIQLTEPVNFTQSITGNGSGLTGLTAGQIPNLNANKINAGVLDNARIPSDLGSRTFSGGLTTVGNLFLTGGNFYMDNSRVILAKNAAGGYDNFIWPRWSDNITYLNYGSGGFNIRNNGNSLVMFMQNGGNVGIATAFPNARLSLGSGDVYEKLAIWDGGSAGNTMGLGVGPGQFRLYLNPDSSRFTFLDAPNGKELVNLYDYDGGAMSIAGGGVYGNIVTSIRPNTTRYIPLSLRATNDGGFVDFSATTAAGWEGMYMYYGNAWKPNGGSWAAASDAKLKKNIAPMSGALDKLAKLRGVNFDWIDPTAQGARDKRQGGFIAQELEEVFPDWVTTIKIPNGDGKVTDDGWVKTISLPFEFDALVVESIKELNQERVSLRKENAELKARLADLETRFSAIESLLKKSTALR